MTICWPLVALRKRSLRHSRSAVRVRELARMGADGPVRIRACLPAPTAPSSSSSLATSPSACMRTLKLSYGKSVSKACSVSGWPMRGTQPRLAHLPGAGGARRVHSSFRSLHAGRGHARPGQKETEGAGGGGRGRRKAASSDHLSGRAPRQPHTPAIARGREAEARAAELCVGQRVVADADP